MGRSRRVTVLAGGVGAARFLRGLCSLPDAPDVTVVVNTGDDDTFFGLHVSPDIDTVTYTLAGRVAPAQGWGLRNDTFHCLEALARLYPETWFRLGDADLATHIYRTDQLRRGRALGEITAAVARQNGVPARILPMSNQPVRTMVTLAEHGTVPFQVYLVRLGGNGTVRAIRFAGLRKARPAPGVIDAIGGADFVIIPPSNPLVSIEPILRITGVRAARRDTCARVAAVSPLVRGRPIKGPLDRMMAGLRHEVSALGVARLYRGIADIFVLDAADAELAPRLGELGMQAVVTNTLMRTRRQSEALANAVLHALELEEGR